MNSHRPPAPEKSDSSGAHSAGDQSPPTADLDKLAEAARQDNPEAIEILLQTLLPMVLRYCRARMAGRNLSYLSAEDVAQEVCLAVLGALPKYEDRGGSFLYLVRAIASNKVIDAYRQGSRDRTEPVAELPELSATENEPENHVLDLDLGVRVARLLNFLPQHHQEILTLRVVIGLSAEETGQAMGISATNVRVVQHRALGRLRRLALSSQKSLLTQC